MKFIKYCPECKNRREYNIEGVKRVDGTKSAICGTCICGKLFSDLFHL